MPRRPSGGSAGSSAQAADAPSPEHSHNLGSARPRTPNSEAGGGSGHVGRDFRRQATSQAGPGASPRGSPRVIRAQTAAWEAQRALESEEPREEAEEHEPEEDEEDEEDEEEEEEPPRPRKGCCRRRCRAIVHKLYVALFAWRKDHRLSNSWVDLGDRAERQADLHARYVAKAHQEKEEWAAQKVPLCKQLCRLLRSSIRAARLVVYEAILTCFGRIDSRTGLPTFILERYRFLELAGQGPHGWVYKVVEFKVEDKLDDEEIEAPPEEIFSAVRVRDKARGQLLEMELLFAKRLLRKEGKGGARGARLRRCCTALGCMRPRFAHGCIVEQRRVLETNELFVEITEYMAGGSLREHVQATLEPVDEYSACHAITRVLSALQYMHKRRLVHRDVRLSQILLPAKGDLDGAKLCDLWCMKRVRKKGFLHDKRRPVDILSTAPEVLMHGTWSDKADIWSVGCVLFELLYGHPPHGGHGAALLHRICHEDPEFDLFCGRASKEAVDLLKQLLRRNPFHRPSASMAMAHKWFQEYGGERPKTQARRIGQQLKTVKLMGKQPPCRAGMPASNLLQAQAGSMNTGFCTYMGLTSCNIDFEISGSTTGNQEFWITAIVISLWGTTDNPQEVSLLHSVRPGVPYVDVMQHKVEDPSAAQARLDCERPMRRARLSFRHNFGGVHGITLRKIAFYGYEVRPLHITVDLDKSTFERGADVHVHSSQLDARIVSEVLHRSLTDDLKKGHRIPGTNRRYQVLRDITSGIPHHSSRVTTPPLELPAGVTLTAAILGLRYVSVAPPKAESPKMRVMLLRDVEGGEVEKTLLFEVLDLEPPDWDTDRIIALGYADYPELFKDDLSFSTDEKLRLQLLFENNAGVLHIPAKFGLTFYYVPEVSTPSERSVGESDDEDEDEGKAGEEQQAQVEHQQTDNSQAAQEGTTWEEFSEHADSEQYEKELQDGFNAAAEGSRFGAVGPGPAPRTEGELWRPYLDPGSDGVLWPPPWWDEKPEEAEIATGWGEASTDEGASSARSEQEGGHEGSPGKERRASGGGSLGSDAGGGTAEQGKEDRLEAERALAREKAMRQLGIFKKEALEQSRRRAEVRTVEADAANAKLRGAGGNLISRWRDLQGSHGAAGCCSAMAPPPHLETCARQFAGPLAACGFTPSPPPPSPRGDV